MFGKPTNQESRMSGHLDILMDSMKELAEALMTHGKETPEPVKTAAQKSVAAFGMLLAETLFKK